MATCTLNFVPTHNTSWAENGYRGENSDSPVSEGKWPHLGDWPPSAVPPVCPGAPSQSPLCTPGSEPWDVQWCYWHLPDCGDEVCGTVSSPGSAVGKSEHLWCQLLVSAVQLLPQPVWKFKTLHYSYQLFQSSAIHFYSKIFVHFLNVAQVVHSPSFQIMSCLWKKKERKKTVSGTALRIHNAVTC